MVNNLFIEIYIWIIFFYPTFWGYTLASGNSFGQLILNLSVIAFVLIVVLLKHLRIILPKSYFILFFLQALSYTITLAYNQFDTDSTISFKDYTDIIRPFFYIIAISVPFIFKFRLPQLSKILRTIILACLSTLIFDIIKFFSFGIPLMKLYTGLEPGTFNYIRFSGTFAYCYNFGFIILFLLYEGCIQYKHKIIWGFTCLTIIILTGSRSCLLALSIGIIYFIFSNKVTSVNKIKYILMTFLVSATILLVLSLFDLPIINDIFNNYDKLLSSLSSGVASDGSLMTRNSQLERVMSSLNKHLLLGIGPMKTQQPIEIQIGYYLSSWGLIGTTIFLLIISSAAYFAFKSSMNSCRIIRQFSRANLLWICSSFIIGLSTPITDQARVFQLFYLIQGIQYYIYLQTRKELNSFTK